MKLPKLHLRDLFWLVLVCALAVGWFVHYRAMIADKNAAVDFERELRNSALMSWKDFHDKEREAWESLREATTP